MKSICIITFFLLSVLLSNAQNRFPNNNFKKQAKQKVSFKSVRINHGLIDGTLFDDETKMFKKSLLLGAGLKPVKQPLLSFYDFPATIINGENKKSRVWLGIKDRNNLARLNMIGETGGLTSFNIYNNEQSSIFSVYTPNNQSVFMNLEKPNSYFVLGGVQNENLDPTNKLIIKNGGAKVEGTVFGKKIILDHELQDGVAFPNGGSEMWSKGLLIGAGKDSANQPLFGFYDLPERTENGVVKKATLMLNIEDRLDKARLRLMGDLEGKTIFNLYDNQQNISFELNSPDTKYSFLSMPKPDSYINIGGFKEWSEWDRKYKLNVFDGSANIEGDILGRKIEVEHNLESGIAFPNGGSDMWSKGLLIGAGKDSAGQPLFGFYDLPERTENGVVKKATLMLNIEDRLDKSRMRLIGDIDGQTIFNIFDNQQGTAFQVYAPGDERSIVNMPKDKSHLVIGAQAVPNDLSKKLVIKNGDALIEGEVRGKVGIFDNILEDGQEFTDWQERNRKCLSLGAGKEHTTEGRTEPDGSYTFSVYDFPKSNLDQNPFSLMILEDKNYKSRWRSYAYPDGPSHIWYYDKTQKLFCTLEDDGNDNVAFKLPKPNSVLTIGTSSSTDSNGQSYMLSVKGKVRADEVKVYTNWADYVFHDNYQLPTLKEVEEHIKEKGHLKDIPSAKEVEENGIQLGEMNKLLLQKIEELTLYTIQLKKEIDELKAKK